MILTLVLAALLAGPPSTPASPGGPASAAARAAPASAPGEAPTGPAVGSAPAGRPPARTGDGWPVARASACRAARAQRCSPAGCEAVTEGLDAEQFALELVTGTVGACLYTDCFSGPARLVRDAEAPWQVTAVAEVRSERPPGATPPPGSAPFALTLSVDLRDGRFTATWAHSPDGLQVDFGTCRLERAP